MHASSYFFEEMEITVKGKAVPLQGWSGPEDSRKLRFPDYMTMAQDGGIHCTGGWVGPKGRSGRAKNLVPTGIQSQTVQPVAQSLYRPTYPTNKHKLYKY